MGRPRMYTPHSATAMEKKAAQQLMKDACLLPGGGRGLPEVRCSPEEVEDYLKFCELNKEIRSRSHLLALYAAQLKAAGLKASTIKSRLENAKGINPFASDPRDARVAQALVGAAVHASAVSPPKKKVALRLADLTLPLRPRATTTRDLRYQAFWWVLLVTGGRPHNVREAAASWVEAGQKLRVLWHGRKSDPAPCKVAYWGSEGKTHLTDYAHLKPHINDALRSIGTPDNVAACINAPFRSLTQRRVDHQSARSRSRISTKLIVPSRSTKETSEENFSFALDFSLRYFECDRL
jgi:hypothetical protein